MSKYIQFFLIALFPYLIVFALICMFKTYFMDTVFHNNIFSLLLILIVLYVVALGCAVTAFIASLAKESKILDVLRINIIIKLIHIPAYLFIFVVGLSSMITIFTSGISIVLVILDGMTIALSGLIGLGGVIKSLRENKIFIKAAIIHGILQFVFCVAIISSIVIYRTVKATEYDYKHNLQSS
jgi:hypothetical protein